MRTSTVGLCVSVVFGTAATYLRNSNQIIMSRYMTGSAVSIVAFLSIRGFILNTPTQKKKEITQQQGLSPLEHLRVLNYQPRSISSILVNIPATVNTASNCGFLRN
ncbi:hypothetical protein A0J61_00780 [Choanephora cucurbitarum]|uniref:Uncharacterized protein n=1 Tax=Choanephora cucurbitarum TaxID=101091 RepID=A0A1C7NPY2_9FUNG|nr:hypothetical protein A0J61_00780 [Choanephora cucurbitarum]